MRAEKIEGAVGFLIGAEPWNVVEGLTNVMNDILPRFSRWDGATFDAEGLVLIGSMRVEEERVGFFIVVKYHCDLGGWTEDAIGRVNGYLTWLNLGGYLGRDGHNRFLASVSVSE